MKGIGQEVLIPKTNTLFPLNKSKLFNEQDQYHKDIKYNNTIISQSYKKNCIHQAVDLHAILKVCHRCIDMYSSKKKLYTEKNVIIYI